MQPDPECQYAHNYTIHQILGQGGQANVYLASIENDFFAVKVYFPGQSKQEAFAKQRQFLGHLKFEHLINLIDAQAAIKVKLKNQPEVTRNILVTEFAQGREMFEYISKAGRFPEEVCRTLFKQLISAIAYLDSKGVAHRDLKPQNILFSKNFLLKVADFGLSIMAAGHQGDGVLHSKVGTDGYKAPQVEQGNYNGLKADLFAAGVVLFIMFNGTPPFLSTLPHDRIYKFFRDGTPIKFWQLHQKKKPGFFPASFKNLINSLLCFNPLNRANLQTLAEDPWMNGPCCSLEEVYKFMHRLFLEVYQNDPVSILIARIRAELAHGTGNFNHFNHIYISIDMEIEQNPGLRDTLSEQILINLADLAWLSKVQIKPSYKNKQLQLKPSQIIASLKEFLRQSFKTKNVFTELPFDEIDPISYELQMTQGATNFTVTLKFITKEGDEQDQIQTRVRGDLVAGVESGFNVVWTKEGGNTFWHDQIIFQMQNFLTKLATTK